MAGLAARLLAAFSYILLAGGILFQFFIILSGYIETTPIKNVYFLQADTSRIPGAPLRSRWTYLAICGTVDGHNGNCRSPRAALPFDPERNFGTTTNVPAAFLDTHYYYYMSRFAFAFYLIALFFAACTLLTGLLACCFVRVASIISVAVVSLAFAFQALATVLMTVWTVKGRNRFRENDQSAKLGQYAYGFSWASTACFFICAILYLIEHRAGRPAAGGSFFDKKAQRQSGHFETTGAGAADYEKGADPDKSSFERRRD